MINRSIHAASTTKRGLNRYSYKSLFVKEFKYTEQRYKATVFYFRSKAINFKPYIHIGIFLSSCITLHVLTRGIFWLSHIDKENIVGAIFFDLQKSF